MKNQRILEKRDFQRQNKTEARIIITLIQNLGSFQTSNLSMATARKKSLAKSMKGRKIYN